MSKAGLMKRVHRLVEGLRIREEISKDEVPLVCRGGVGIPIGPNELAINMPTCLIFHCKFYR